MVIDEPEDEYVSKSVYRTVPAISVLPSAPYGATAEQELEGLGELEQGGSPILRPENYGCMCISTCKLILTTTTF